MSLDVAVERWSDGGAFTLTGVGFSVARGSIVGIAGPNGSGKSTLLDMLLGLRGEVHGSITWNGCRIDGTQPHDRPFAAQFQTPALFPRHSVEQNVTMPSRVRGVAPPARLDAILDRLGLNSLRRTRASRLSGGEKQRVALARALLDGRTGVLLDEPFSGIDVEARAAAQELLVSEVAERQLTVVLVTHEIDTLTSLVNRCVVLKNGAQVGLKDPADILREPASAFEARLAGYRNVVSTVNSELGRFLSRTLRMATLEMLIVLPDDAMSLSPVGGTDQGIDGRVTARLTSHTHDNYVVNVLGTTVTVSQMRVGLPSLPLRVGDVCRVSFDAERLLVVPDR